MAPDDGGIEKLKAAPQFVQRSLVGAYLLGQTFLLQGNASAVLTGIRAQDLDRAFRSPPESSEQILHPEKYWDNSRRDPPRKVTLPDLSSVLGRGWSLQTTGVLGELTLAIVAGADPIDVTLTGVGQWTNDAAAGWGGDLWHLYEDGERSVALLGTLWDSEEDAVEFEESQRPSKKRLIVRRGDALVIVAGEAGKHAETIARRALDSLKPPDSAD